MKFTFQRDRTIESTLGHVLHFEKDVPQYAPPELHKLVLDSGGEPDEDIPEEVKKTSNTPSDPTERSEALQAAMKLLVENGQREDFTGTGAPQVKALEALLGWKPDSAERDAAWLAVQAEGL